MMLISYIDSPSDKVGICDEYDGCDEFDSHIG